MKKNIIRLAAIILLGVLAVVATLFKSAPKEISRDNYPYIVMSKGDNESVADSIKREDMSLDEVIGVTNDIVVGEFITDVNESNLVSTKYYPTEGTRDYEFYHKVAEAWDTEYDNVLPKICYYEFLFKVNQKITGDSINSDIITIRVNSLNKDSNFSFPTILKGTKALLLIHTDFDSKTFYSGATGLYYIDEYDRVISASSYDSLDKYTGTNINDFKVILSNALDRAGPNNSDSSNDIIETTEPETTAAIEPDTTDVKVSEPASEPDTTASDSSTSEGGAA